MNDMTYLGGWVGKHQLMVSRQSLYGHAQNHMKPANPTLVDKIFTHSHTKITTHSYTDKCTRVQSGDDTGC